MLYHILYQYFDINIFKYITFRGFLALITAFFLSLVVYPYIIKKLKALQRLKGGYERPYLDTHKNKRYTPSMGGVIISITVLFSVLLWCRFDNFFIWILIFTLISFSFLGFIDDWKKLHKKNGISLKVKLAFQILFSFIISITLYFYPKFDSILYFPFFKNLYFDLGIFYIFFMVFVIVATSNAVNLTDGLDGLAIGPALTSVSAFTIFSYIAGNSVLSSYLFLPYIEGSGEIAVFLMALLGAGLGFLWFNSFPADIFMGDTGSLSIGAILGTTAIITKQELVLAIVGGIFVAETLSVIIQVSYFKTTGKRIFLMAPIHHHFEKRGIPENKIVVRVWIISIILAIVALSTLKLR